MSRLSVLPKEKLTPEFAKMTETAEETGNGTVFQVLGHRADMFESYFKFYYATHEGGVVKPAIKELVRLRIAQLNNCFT